MVLYKKYFRVKLSRFPNRACGANNRTNDCVNDQQHSNINQITNIFRSQSKNLGEIIRGLKIGFTKFAPNNDIPCEWQARFHVRVLRINNDELKIRCNYIKNNPINWWNNMCNPCL